MNSELLQKLSTKKELFTDAQYKQLVDSLGNEFYELTYLEFTPKEASIKEGNGNRVIYTSTKVQRKIFRLRDIRPPGNNGHPLNTLENMKMYQGSTISFNEPDRDKPALVFLGGHSDFPIEPTMFSQYLDVDDGIQDDNCISIFVRGLAPILLDIKKIS